MFYFLCRTRTSLLHGRQKSISSQSYKLFHMLFPNDPSIFRVSNYLRWISKTSNQDSFTVSYLTNKLGLSLESAPSASKYIHLKTTSDNPDSVISILEKHGFSETQIKTIINKSPSLLSYDVEKTFLPMLEFFQSKGVSSSDLVRFLRYNPNVLVTSLENKVIPFFSSFSNLFHSDEYAIKAIKAILRYPNLISFDIDAYLLPNINILRDNGVPESNIIKGIDQYHSILMVNPGRLKEVVREVKEMGLNPLKMKFVTMRKSTFQRKVDALKKWVEGGCEKLLMHKITINISSSLFSHLPFRALSIYSFALQFIPPVISNGN